MLLEMATPTLSNPMASFPNVIASAANNYGETPMDYAAQTAHTDIVNIFASLPIINASAADNVGMYVSPCRFL